MDQLHTPAAGFAGAGVATLPRTHIFLPFLASIAEGIVLPMTVALARIDALCGEKLPRVI